MLGALYFRTVRWHDLTNFFSPSSEYFHQAALFSAKITPLVLLHILCLTVNFTTNKHRGIVAAEVFAAWIVGLIWNCVLQRLTPLLQFNWDECTSIRRQQFVSWTHSLSRCAYRPPTLHCQLVRWAELLCSAQHTHVSPHCILAPKVYQGRVYPTRKTQHFCACGLAGFTGKSPHCPTSWACGILIF